MDGRCFTVQVLREEEIPEALRREAGPAADRLLTEDGQWLIRTDEGWLRFPAKDGGEKLAGLLGGGFSGGRVTRLEEAGRKLLAGCDEAQAEQLLRRFGLRNQKERCVIAFEGRDAEGGRLYTQLKDLIPSEEGDLLTAMDEGTVALIKDLSGSGKEEIAEFTRAVIESAENEAGLRLKAGIGAPRDRWTRLAESYEEACLAIRIGEAFRLPERVLIHEELFLERMINEIPEKRRKELRDSMLSGTPEALQTPEMTETIRTFFQNDLSSSATARALFIHRNTLNYRLERIRQETGLDIRRFQDAVILMMLMKLA